METSICISCNFTKSNTPPWVFFTLFKLYKWYKIAQHITFDQCSNSNQQLVLNYLAIMSAFSLRYLIAWDEGGNERAGDGNTVPRISSLKKKFNKMFTAKNVILKVILLWMFQLLLLSWFTFSATICFLQSPTNIFKLSLSIN